MLAAMPRISICDTSHCADVFLYSEDTVALLRRCSELRHVYYETDNGALDSIQADTLMQIQRAVPRVCWQLHGAPEYNFSE